MCSKDTTHECRECIFNSPAHCCSGNGRAIENLSSATQYQKDMAENYGVKKLCMCEEGFLGVIDHLHWSYSIIFI